MIAIGHQLLLCCVFSSLLLPASCSLVHRRRSLFSPLPFRTVVVDSPLSLQHGVAAFAVYQEVAPFVQLHQHRSPPSVQLCDFDRLGSHSWPPTAVCWFPPTFPQLVPANNLTAFEGKAGSAERTEVVPVVDISKSLEGLPGAKGSSPLEYTQIGARAGFSADTAKGPLAKVDEALNKLGVNDMPGLVTSFSSLRFCHKPSWDKYEVLWFNTRALLLLAWPVWALSAPLLPLSNAPWSVSLSFVGSNCPLGISLKCPAPLVARVLQPSQIAGSISKDVGLLMEGQSFASEGASVTGVVMIGLVLAVIGFIKRTGRLETALAASQADVKAINLRLVQLGSHHSTSKARLSAAAKQRRGLTRQHGSLIKALRRSDKQRAALQQKAVQLQQLSISLMDTSRSMQHANNSMGSEMQLLKAELGKVQDQLAALQNRPETPSTEAEVGKGAEVAANYKGMNNTLQQVSYGSLHDPGEDIAKVEAAGAGGSRGLSHLSQPAYPTSQGSPRIAAGRLRDHRGDYCSESDLAMDNPWNPSFSGSFTSSFDLSGMQQSRDTMGKSGAAISGQRMSTIATPLGSASATDQTTVIDTQKTQDQDSDPCQSGKTPQTLIRVDSKVGRFLSRFKRGNNLTSCSQ